MIRSPRLFAVIAMIALAVSVPATADVIDPYRGVIASGEGNSLLQSQIEMDDDFSGGLGVFVTGAGIIVDIDDVDGTSDASQDSDLSGGLNHFEGAASTNGVVSGAPAVGSFFAESTMDFAFDVDQSVDWWISGSISTSFLGGSNAFVIVEIWESTGTEIFSAFADAANSTVNLAGSGTFHPGITYEVSVKVRSLTLIDDLVTTGSAIATANFDVFIPEPGTGLMVSLGLTLLLRRRRRQQGCRG